MDAHGSMWLIQFVSATISASIIRQIHNSTKALEYIHLFHIFKCIHSYHGILKSWNLIRLRKALITWDLQYKKQWIWLERAILHFLCIKTKANMFSVKMPCYWAKHCDVNWPKSLDFVKVIHILCIYSLTAWNSKGKSTKKCHGMTPSIEPDSFNPLENKGICKGISGWLFPLNSSSSV